MSLLLHQIIRLARSTFDPKNLSTATQNYAKLKDLVDKLSINDINLPVSVLSGHSIPPAYKDGPPSPCAHVPLLEHPDVGISIFILAANEVMPLHDHPQMYGMLKAISGNLSIEGFTAIDDQQQPISVYRPDMQPLIVVRPEMPVMIRPTTEAVTLSPSVGNFHKISAIDGPAAFFDILSPPYNTKIPVYGSRPCTYYKSLTDGQRVYLEQYECPEEFYCVPIAYNLNESMAES